MHNYAIAARLAGGKRFCISAIMPTSEELRLECLKLALVGSETFPDALRHAADFWQFVHNDKVPPTAAEIVTATDAAAATVSRKPKGGA